MDEITAIRKPPRGLERLLWRAPIWLYRLRLGGLLGSRFLLLTHTGRTSGLPRQAVVEVAGYDQTAGAYLVASGFGRRSDWFRNIEKTPAVTIQMGNRRMAARAEILSPEASGEALADYARRHPRAARSLARVLGLQVDGSEASYRAAGRSAIPFVRLRVQPPGEG